METVLVLFRTEFLFMNRTTLPDEEEQFNIYKSVAKSMGKSTSSYKNSRFRS